MSGLGNGAVCWRFSQRADAKPTPKSNNAATTRLIPPSEPRSSTRIGKTNSMAPKHDGELGGDP